MARLGPPDADGPGERDAEFRLALWSAVTSSARVSRRRHRVERVVAGLNVLVAGKAQAGKMTLLSALCDCTFRPASG